jgi:hypothetical protein
VTLFLLSIIFNVAIVVVWIDFVTVVSLFLSFLLSFFFLFFLFLFLIYIEVSRVLLNLRTVRVRDVELVVTVLRQTFRLGEEG